MGKIEILIKDNKIKILINGLIHVFIKADEFIAFQSWIGDDDRYYIEFYTTKQYFYTEYDDEKKWKQILKLLNVNL